MHHSEPVLADSEEEVGRGDAAAYPRLDNVVRLEETHERVEFERRAELRVVGAPREMFLTDPLLDGDRLPADLGERVRSCSGGAPLNRRSQS